MEFVKWNQRHVHIAGPFICPYRLFWAASSTRLSDERYHSAELSKDSCQSAQTFRLFRVLQFAHFNILKKMVYFQFSPGDTEIGKKWELNTQGAGSGGSADEVRHILRQELAGLQNARRRAQRRIREIHQKMDRLERHLKQKRYKK